MNAFMRILRRKTARFWTILPVELKEKLKTAELRIGSDESLRSIAIKFIVSDIKATPQRTRQTIDRICEFFMASDQGTSPEALLENFKVKFKLNGDKGADPEENLNTEKSNEKEQEKAFENEVKKINQQVLFRSFYASLDFKRRERLVDFIIKHKLCDAGLESELRARIMDERKTDEKEIETLLAQAMKGGLDDLTWMHQMLLALFSSVVSSQDSLVELQRKLDAAAKSQPPSAASTQMLVDAKDLSEQYEKSAKDELARKALDAKVAELQNELKHQEELFAEKMDLERSKLEMRLLENSNAKQGENFAMQSRLAGNLLASFMKTLPPEHAEAGRELLNGIMRDCYGDPGFMQDAKTATTLELKVKDTQDGLVSKTLAESRIKTQEKRDKNWLLITLTIIFGIIALLAVITALGLGSWIWQLKAKPACIQPAVSYRSDGISRLAGVRLDTQEDIAKAYDMLKPSATIDETRFLNARSQAIQNAKDRALPK